MDEFNECRIVELCKLLTDAKVSFKQKKNKISTNRLTVCIPQINRDIAYLAGVVTGDGSMIRCKRNRGGFHHVIKITSGSKQYAEYLSRLFFEKFGYGGTIIRDLRKKATYYLDIKSSVIFWYFVLLGFEIGRKQKTKVPICFKQKKDLFLTYLAGLVDTDGHVTGNRIQLKQKDKSFLEELFDLLQKLEFNPNPPKVNYTNHIPFYYIRFDNNLPLRYRLSGSGVERPAIFEFQSRP